MAAKESWRNSTRTTCRAGRELVKFEALATLGLDEMACQVDARSGVAAHA